MKLHSLKLNIKYCDDVLSGKKSFEVRKNDRNFQVGDLIKFYPFETVPNSHVLRACKHEIINACFIITYILSDIGLKDDYVVLAIVPEKPKFSF